MTYEPSNAFEPPIDENVNFSKDFNKFLDQITRRYRDIARKLNEKERAYYPLNLEIVNDQKYFTAGNPQKFRTVFRKIIATGQLPNAAASPVNHNLTPTVNWLFTNISGFARDPATPIWIPMPNMGAAYPVQLHVTVTQVIITTTVNLNAFTDSWVVLEYVKT